MILSEQSRPHLAAGCRLRDDADGGPVLLLPEHVLKLNASGLRILKMCDGERTFGEMQQELAAEFPGVEIARIGEEISQFLSRLHEKRAIDWD